MAKPRVVTLDRPQPQCCATCAYQAPPLPTGGGVGHCTLYDLDLRNDLTRLVCWSYTRDPTRNDLYRKLDQGL